MAVLFSVTSYHGINSKVPSIQADVEDSSL